MRTPCPKCGAHGVWTRAAEVKHERGSLSFCWVCTMCQHEWKEGHIALQLKANTVRQPVRPRKIRR
jgi:hypothetical protein